MNKAPLSLLATALCLPATLGAQQGVVPGLDLQLTNVDLLRVVGAQAGDYAFSMSTFFCNTGSSAIGWRGPMSGQHPVVGFMVARQIGNRLEQISDRSWLRHEWNPTNESGCATCSTPGGNMTLGSNCSTFSNTGDNSNAFYLGPPIEFEPFGGVWTGVGSYFDRGDPSAGGAQAGDGLRSLTTAQSSALGTTVHRAIVDSTLLAQPDVDYYYAANVFVAGEAEALRNDNLGSREVFIDANGGTIANLGPFVSGSILERWEGARVESVTNSLSGQLVDGRFYVGAHVEDLGGGMFHYEYAVHNRDNAGGATSFELEVCPSALITNQGFHDVDDNSTNDWVMSRPMPTRVLFEDLVGGNPQPYNTVFNFWFDSDVGPLDREFRIFQADIVGRAPILDLMLPTPSGAERQPVQYGMGCGPVPPPTLSAIGDGTLPNPNFQLDLTNGGAFNPILIQLSITPGSLVFQGCEFSLTNEINIFNGQLDMNENFRLPIPLPDNPMFNGVSLYFQAYIIDAVTGQVFNLITTSNGLEVPLGCN